MANVFRASRVAALILQSIRSVTEAYRSSFTRDTIYVFAGNTIQALSTFAAITLIARQLTVTDFGIFALAFATLGLVVTFADLGLNTGMIHFVSGFLSRQRWADARSVLQMNLRWRMIAGASFILIGYLATPYVATSVWREQRLIGPLYVAIVGSLGIVLLSFGTAAQVSAKLFQRAVIAWILSGAVRLISVIAFSIGGKLTFTTAIAAMVIGPFVAMLWTFWKRPTIPITSSAQNSRVLRMQVVNFSTWVALSALVGALRSRSDIFLLGRFAQTETIGQFAAAQQLSLAVPLLTGALTTALLPRVAALDGIPAIRTYIDHILRWVPAAVALAILGPITVRIVMPWVFGPGFAAAILPAQILLAGYSISLIVNPVGLIFFRVNRPRFLAAVNFLQLMIVVAVGMLLIPRLGAVGAALSTVAAEISSSVVIGAFALKILSNRSRSGASTYSGEAMK